MIESTLAREVTRKRTCRRYLERQSLKPKERSVSASNISLQAGRYRNPLSPDCSGTFCFGSRQKGGRTSSAYAFMWLLVYTELTDDDDEVLKSLCL